MDKIVVQRRTRYSKMVSDDHQYLGDCPRTLDPLSNPVHDANATLWKKVRAQLDIDRRRFLSALAVLGIVETVSMMAEDGYHLGDPDKGLPMHNVLLLRELEQRSLQHNPDIHMSYVVELLSSDILTLPPKLIERRELKTKNTEMGVVIAPPADVNEVMRSVQPEDLVQLHIDVERFLTLVRMHGPEEPTLFIKDLTEMVYEKLCPWGRSTTPQGRWKQLLEQVAMVGIDVANVDIDLMRRSIVGMLATAYQELCHLTIDDLRF
jgi:hypothetical protein